ncbi:MAG TPA: hypothetical protein VN843_01185 [Anaerolineales bacterium]|nr:hypothetical protein [Anaerolineales bacterium]
MKRLISANLAGNILLIFMGLLVIFHILVLLGVVPADIIWGGQMESVSNDFITLEIISLLLTLAFATIIAAKIGYIKTGNFEKIVSIGVWVIFAYFILNTIGNLASGVSAENWFFAPITLVLAFLALRLAIEKP